MSTAGAPITSLIPHRGPSLFIEEVVELYDDGIDCRGCIPHRAALARDGRAPAFLGLEMAAQAAAVYEALRRAEGGDSPLTSRIGYLVTLRRVQLELPELPLDTPLSVSVRLQGGAAVLALYDARVLWGDRLCVQGTIGTYLPPEAGEHP